MRLMFRPLLLVALAGLLVGCQGQVASRLGERAVVKGRVTVNGKPVTRGTVVLTPMDLARGDEQIGPIGVNGTYISSVFPGTYKVSFADANVPARYRSAYSSGLEIDVPSRGRDDANFDLK